LPPERANASWVSSATLRLSTATALPERARRKPPLRWAKRTMPASPEPARAQQVSLETPADPEPRPACPVPAEPSAPQDSPPTTAAPPSVSETPAADHGESPL